MGADYIRACMSGNWTVVWPERQAVGLWQVLQVRQLVCGLAGAVCGQTLLLLSQAAEVLMAWLFRVGGGRTYHDSHAYRIIMRLQQPRGLETASISGTDTGLWQWESDADMVISACNLV